MQKKLLALLLSFSLLASLFAIVPVSVSAEETETPAPYTLISDDDTSSTPYGDISSISADRALLNENSVFTLYGYNAEGYLDEATGTSAVKDAAELTDADYTHTDTYPKNAGIGATKEEGEYFIFVADIGHVAKIDTIAVYNKISTGANAAFRLRDFDFLAVNSLDDITTAEALATYNVGNDEDTANMRHVLKIANPVKARYVVLRVRDWGTNIGSRFEINAYGSIEHTYDKQVATEEYFASAATTEAAAKYYYSCECGEKGTETFSYGEPLAPYTLISDQTNTNYTASEIGEGDFLGNVDDTEIYVRAYEEDGTLAKEYVGFGTGKVDEANSYVLGTGTATASNFAFIRSSDGYDYFDAIIDLGSTKNISAMLVNSYVAGSGTNLLRRLRKFDFLAVNSLDDLATAEAMASFDVDNDINAGTTTQSGNDYTYPSSRHLLKIANPVAARYAVIRIYEWQDETAVTNGLLTSSLYGRFSFNAFGTNHECTLAEVVDDKYLVSEASCDSAAIYYKSCSACGVASTETFTYGTAAHTFDQQETTENYLATAATTEAAATYYYSCACGEKGTETFSYGEKLEPYTLISDDDTSSTPYGDISSISADRALLNENSVFTLYGYNAEGYLDEATGTSAVKDAAELTDADYTHTDTYPKNAGIGATKEEGEYFIFVADIGHVAKIDTIAVYNKISTGANAAFRLRDFDFLAVNSLDDITTAEALATYNVGNDEDTANMRHVLKIANPVKARYVVLRVRDWGTNIGSRFEINAYGSIEHTYDKQVATEEYFASAATTEAAAKYYYSCECGEKGTETFSYGEPLAPYTLISDQTNTNYTASEIGEGDFLGNVDDTEIYVRAYEEDGTLAKEYVGFGTGKVDEANSYVLGTGTATASNFAFIRSSDGYDYFDAIIDLGSTKNISAMLVNSYVAGSGTNLLRRLRKFDFLAVNSLDDLATAEAMASYDVANDANKTTYTSGDNTYDVPSSRHLLKIANPVAARYAVIRIYEWQDETAVTNGLLTSSLYGRFSFNAFGTAVDSGEEDHTCVFDKEIATEDYLAEAATCTTAAKYYYSCECGEKGTETFTYGEVDATEHSGTLVTDEAVAANCQEGGLTEGSHWDCCGATEVAQVATEIDPSNHVDAEAVVDAAVAATCKEGGLTEGSHWECCGATEVAQVATEIDPSNHVDAEAVVDAAVAATCKEGGLTEGSHWNCCGATEVAQVATEVDPTNHVGTLVTDDEVIATCQNGGLTAGSHWDCCNAIEVAQEPTEIDPSNHVNPVPVEDPAVAATKDAPGKTAGTKYECCGVAAEVGATTYYVEFVCDGKVVYTTEVVEGATLSEDDLAAADAAKYNGVGYIFKGWDNPTNGAITGPTTFVANYERDILTKYSVTVNGSDAVEYAFDTKITVKTVNEEEALWTVNGEKYDIGAVAVFYAFGAMDIVAEEITDESIKETPFVSILKTFDDNGEYIAIIHAYAAGQEISEIGAIYWNSKYTFESRPNETKMYVESNSPDAMTTLYGIKNGQGRAVKAYAIIGGVEYTSDAQTATF